MDVAACSRSGESGHILAVTNCRERREMTEASNLQGPGRSPRPLDDASPRRPGSTTAAASRPSRTTCSTRPPGTPGAAAVPRSSTPRAGRSCGWCPTGRRRQELLVRAYPDQPWRIIIDLRNIVAHHDDSLSTRRVWDTLVHDTPARRAHAADVMVQARRSERGPSGRRAIAPAPRRGRPRTGGQCGSSAGTSA